MIPSHFKLRLEPLADPAAVVHVPNLRLTVLTSRLIRIEYSPADQFDDRASQRFWYRRQPVPKFRVDHSADRLTLTTEHVILRYRVTSDGPTYDTLSVEVPATKAVWHYGQMGKWENLGGTIRTLDMVNGETRLDPGLMSRAGWAVVDDSKSLLLSEEGWVEAREHEDCIDLYFFGYGHDFQSCLRDFCAISGHTPLVPRWMLGNWWSRFWAYSQEEILNLMTEFKKQGVPLSVCIIDMDWHITETGNRSSGWTGYTWNRKLFPDPEACLRTLHEMGLHVALNLHPAEGIHPHEEQYQAMAQVLGHDTSGKLPIEFDLSNPKFAQAYFELLHHPYEAKGVDFWWLDWQQGTLSRLPGLDPLTWLNHLHFYDLAREGSRRPVIFSRWGGIGSHRYPIGFSGDTIISWESLAFQPYLTATAANVGYGWWSHDIGGHQRGVEESELYARWVQYGVFSPILRLHSTKNPYHERRPWGWGEEVLRVTRDAMQLRHSLIPYIYTMAWRNTTFDRPLITPLYWDYPESPDAYRCPKEYSFGSELIAAPFVSPADPATRLARQNVWFPGGDWFGLFDGTYYSGDRWQAIYGGLDEIPVFARAGAIVPLAPKMGWDGIENPAELDLLVFPGASHRFELFEDDGTTTAYLGGKYALTPFENSWRGNEQELTIGPVSGDRATIPERRSYKVAFRGVARPDSVRIIHNGIEEQGRGEYDEATETFSVGELEVGPSSEVHVIIRREAKDLISRRDRRIETLRKMLLAFRLETRTKKEIDDNLEALLQDPSRLTSYGAAILDAHMAALSSVLSSPASITPDRD